MKNAKEMNILAHEVIDRRIAEAGEKARLALANEIVPLIEAKANEGQFAASYHVGDGVDIQTIIDTLRENGYDVRQTGRNLRIWWL